MEIENIKEFVKRTKTSKSTIYRFYKKNEELWLETKIKNNKRVFPTDHAKYFDSEIMFDENKVMKQENKSMRNLINGLMDKNSLITTLWDMGWTFMMTVAYKAERNKRSCFKQMNAMYEELLTKHGDKTELRLFFTTEPFTNRSGYHNHFMIYVANQKLRERVMKDIEEFFSFDRVDSKLYDKYQAGLFYTSKEGLVNEDWDILGNNLGKENKAA